MIALCFNLCFTVLLESGFYLCNSTFYMINHQHHYTDIFSPPSSSWPWFLIRLMMSRRWSLNLFCFTNALLLTMPFSCWLADRYDFSVQCIVDVYLVQITYFIKHGLLRLCWCCFPSRGRWVCRWNSLMVWCDFTDLGCLQETVSSHIKLLTPQGLLCSGDYLTHS